MDLGEHALAVQQVMLDANGLLGVPMPQDWLQVIIGDAVWENCCDGHATISMGQIGPSRYDRGSASAGCVRFDVPWTVEIVDCIDYDDDGTIETASLLAALTTAQARIDAIVCAAVQSHFPVWVTSAEMVGPQGGCVAARVQLRTLYEVC